MDKRKRRKEMNRQINVMLKIKVNNNECDMFCPFLNWNDECALFGDFKKQFQRHKNCIQAEVKLKKARSKAWFKGIAFVPESFLSTELFSKPKR
jgi:hypothetical protein